MLKKVNLFIIIFFIIIISLQNTSAALCKGDDGYYDDCFKLQYGYYPNFYNYPVEYKYHKNYNRNYNINFYDNNYRSYNRIEYNEQVIRKYKNKFYMNERIHTGPYIKDEYGNYRLFYY